MALLASGRVLYWLTISSELLKAYMEACGTNLNYLLGVYVLLKLFRVLVTVNEPSECADTLM